MSPLMGVVGPLQDPGALGDGTGNLAADEEPGPELVLSMDAGVRGPVDGTGVVEGAGDGCWNLLSCGDVLL